MTKILNIIFFLLILAFFLGTYRYYSSNKNIESKNYNRNNIDEIINSKILNLPILINDTDKVIEFNDGFSNKINKTDTRSFWKLLQFK